MFCAPIDCFAVARKANSEFLKPNAVPHAQAKGVDALRKLLSLDKSSSSSAGADGNDDDGGENNDDAPLSSSAHAERPTVGDRVVSLNRKAGYRHGQGVRTHPHALPPPVVGLGVSANHHKLSACAAAVLLL